MTLQQACYQAKDEYNDKRAYTHAAYWFLNYIGRKISASSSAVNSRISRGGSGGGLKHMLTVHPLMFRVGAVCGGLGDTVISCCF